MYYKLFIFLFTIIIAYSNSYAAEYSYDDDNNLILLDDTLYRIDRDGKLNKVADNDNSNNELLGMSSGSIGIFIRQGARILPSIWNYLWRNLSKFDFFRKIRKFIFPRKISNYEKNIIKDSLLKKYSGKRVGQRNKIINRNKKCNNKTSCESMVSGSAPFDTNCNPIQLHHVAQEEDGIILELTKDEHTSNYSTLHSHSKTSEINRSDFDRWKRDYWKSRAIQFCN